MDLLRDEIILGVAGVAGIVIITVAYFYFIGKDGSVLAAASGSIGTIIGYVIKSRK